MALPCSVCAQSEVVLTNAAQLLMSTNAAEGVRARITGVVTYYDRRNHLAFVQDATAGTYVEPTWRIIAPRGFDQPIKAGLLVTLEGRSRRGKFAPFLNHGPTARIHGHVEELPLPMHPLRDSLLDPTFHSQWIQVEAFVRETEIEKRTGRLRLGLTFGPHRFNAFVPGDWETIPDNLLKSDVRVRGVYGSIFNDQRQLVDMRLFVPSLNEITVIDPGMSLAFSQEPRRIAEIMQFNPHLTERIHLRGTVLAHLPGEGIYLRGEDGAIWVGADHTKPLTAGQRVSVVGFPRAGEIRPLLLDAIVKELEETEAPIPVRATPEQVLGRALDGELVRVEARLANLLERPGNSILLLQSERATFNARVLDAAPIADKLRTNSWVEITGICVLEGKSEISATGSRDNLVRAQIEPTSFTLIVRDLADIRVLQSPPWWTPEGVRKVIIGMAVLTGAVALWVAVLRRKVGQQTAIIAERIEMERIAEERARIARELHDTLEQELVGIKMALDTADSRIESSPERARRALDQARAMIRRSQSEARQSVWDLRAANLSHAQLDEALRELILPLNETARTNVRVETEVTAHPALDGVSKNHILRIAQESVTNSLKHADANEVNVFLRLDEQIVELEVTDDGAGFDVPDSLGQNGHFGMIGMHERAGKLGGTLRVNSEPGAGSKIQLTVPLKHQPKA